MNKSIFFGANLLIFPRSFINENLLIKIVYGASLETEAPFSSKMKIILYLKYNVPIKQME